MESIIVDKGVKRATHIPMLARVFELSKGDVLEFGTGYFSTTLLRWLCQMAKRTLYSYESNNIWHQRATNKPVSFHKVFKVDDFNKAKIEKHWGMAFVDHAPAERRRVDIKRLANWAEYIVIHDTNLSKNKYYRYDKIWGLFKYRFDYTRLNPSTTIVSNFHDLSKFEY